MNYAPDLWHDFAVTVGSLAGALTGLLFVALFVLDRRAGHDGQNSAARYVERASPNTVTAVLTGIAGLTMLLRAGPRYRGPRAGRRSDGGVNCLDGVWCS